MSKNIFILMFVVAPILGWEVPPRRLSTNANITETSERYPYIVCLLDKGTIRECSGTLVHAEWVITAAHCIARNDITHVQYGDMTIPPKNTASRSEVLEVRPHPNFIYGRTLTHDIGLLKVRAVPLKEFGTLSDVDFHKLLGRNVEYAGFGIRMTQRMLRKQFRIETLVLVQTRPLHLSEGIVVSCRDIKVQHNSKHFVCVKPICARNVTKLRLSQCVNIHHFAEDSGGPLFFEMKVIGVTSWGGPDRSVPGGVYTPIAPYISWIQKIVNPIPPRKPTMMRRVLQSMKETWARLSQRFKWW